MNNFSLHVTLEVDLFCEIFRENEVFEEKINMDSTLSSMLVLVVCLDFSGTRCRLVYKLALEKEQTLNEHKDKLSTTFVYVFKKSYSNSKRM